MTAAPRPAGGTTDTGAAAALVEDYREFLTSTVGRPDPDQLTAAASFCARFNGPAGFAAAPLPAQLSVRWPARRFVDWLIVTGRLRPTADYLVARHSKLGQLYARAHPDWHAAFATAASDLGFAGQTIQRQWVALAQICALTATAPDRVDAATLADGHTRLAQATGRHGAAQTLHNLRAAVFALESTLFHLGLVDRLGTTKRRTPRARCRQDKWAELPTGLTVTCHHYLDQMAISLRPATVERYEVWLRQFAGFIAALAPPVQRIGAVRRAHIEAFKAHLSDRQAERGQRLARGSVRDALVVLRCFFERLVEWDHPDAPERVPVFAGDIPIKDRPLPRFLDDAAAAKLLRAAAEHPDPFVRVCVQTLARTGLRKGELLGLTIDAVVRIGTAWWLRVPVGKLHTDRFIPLHPAVKDLLDQWQAARPDVRSNLLFVEHGRPISAQRVNAAVAAAATAAGIGHATPHQLRHTLATQAVNRGMSLEAIAALLGHTSMSMTLTYARIADRTVADEYFNITSKVEALYDTAPRQLPADAEGRKMTQLRREMHERMLGNGYCARPPELDCHFESICESCTFFRTTIAFRPTLQAQHDDAATKGQTEREQLYHKLLTRLDTEAS